MGEYAILTNRKRALIALIHSVVFMLIALRALLVSSRSLGLVTAVQLHTDLGGPVAITSIYLVVTAILVWLFVISRGLREKLYFGLCSVSAGTGLLRALVGDPPFHSAQYIRVIMLLCAVGVGTLIWRGHEQPELSSD